MRGYIETMEEAERIPCLVLKRIEAAFREARDVWGDSSYLFKTYRNHPGEAWGGAGAAVWLGRTVGYRLDDCGIESFLYFH